MEADQALEKRFHAVLAALTGGEGERDKLSAGWLSVERHLKKAREMIAELESKLSG